MRKSVILIVVALVVLTIGGFFFFNQDNLRNNKDILQDNSRQDYSFKDIIKNDKNCPVQFTEYLVDLKYVKKVGQIGVVHGSGKNIVERSYISVKEEFYEQKIPLYAPADITLVWGSHYKMPGSSDNLLTDYALRFDAGCGVEITLGHLKEVVESIGKQLTDIKQDSREDTKSYRFQSRRIDWLLCSTKTRRSCFRF